MLFGFGLLGSLIVLAVYVVIIKIKRLNLNKKVIAATVIVSLLFLVLTITSMVVNTKNKQELIQETDGTRNNKTLQKNEGTSETGCGNGMCEPDFGETKTNCSADCSGAN